MGLKNRRRIRFFLLFVWFGFSSKLNSQISLEEKMQWFADAKLGIFIHWGIYAVDGVDESWSFYNNKISHEQYMQQLDGFIANDYNPEFWAKLISASGAKYTVITSKHHDGVALWDTQYSNSYEGNRPLSIPEFSPCHQNVLSPFVAACKREGIRTGIYYSLIDWSSPNYPGYRKDSIRYEIREDQKRWAKFQHYNLGQLRELDSLYSPDLWWFDGDWEHDSLEWQSSEILRIITRNNPNSIVNGRLSGKGDYSTPEQNFPISRPNERYWELCLTTNDNWGYQAHDINWKTPEELITIFTDVIWTGGNLLLDIGPKADGTIPKEQMEILQEFGRWTSRNEEAIYGTIAGLPQGYYHGASTLDKDSTTLYLFVPASFCGELELKGLENKIVSAQLLGSSKQVGYKTVGKISWSKKPGVVFFDVKKSSRSDRYYKVIKVQLDGPIRLYSGSGGL
jgi:alpha-L-fucosidase